jgi:hypothetical protein
LLVLFKLFLFGDGSGGGGGDDVYRLTAFVVY